MLTNEAREQAAAPEQLQEYRDAPERFGPAHPFVETILDSAFFGPKNALCVTVYNESWQAVRDTLISLVRSIGHIHAQPEYASEFSTICIIADGADRLHAETKLGLKRAGILRSYAWPLNANVECHLSLHAADELLRALDVQIETAAIRNPIRFLFCVKKQNTGKLRSHELFFDVLCRRMQPKYCYQVDAGTVVAEDCFLQLVKRMEQDRQVAALAPRITPQTPSLTDDFLYQWQYADFAYRKTVSWPFEVTAGHLSVIPGQVSILRWSALQGGENAPGPVDDPAPVELYLRGVNATDSLERLMYLAEDRIIGTLLVLAKRKAWRLDYVPEAKAVTDPCDTPAELLRQRRRWNNSALACRVWLLKQVFHVMRRADRSLRRKAEFCTAALGQCALAAKELLAPAYVVALVLGLMSVSAASITAAPSLVVTFWTAALADAALAVYRSSGPWGVWMRYVRAGISICAAATLLLLIIQCDPGVALVFLAPAVALIPVALVLPTSSWPVLLRMHFTPFAAFLFIVTTSAYALTHLHDVSWGTKGLLASHVGAAGARSLRRARNRALLGWVLLNAALMAYAAMTQDFADAAVNNVLVAACALDFIMALLAVVYLAFAYRSRRRQADHRKAPKFRADLKESDRSSARVPSEPRLENDVCVAVRSKLDGGIAP